MLRTLFLTVTVLFIAIGGGAWSVHHVLLNFDGFGRLHIGQWQAFPDAGTENADPYATASAARRGDAALGQAEGLVFYLWGDDEGKPLTGRCRYRFKGSVPEARFFTLYAADKNLVPEKISPGLRSELYSQDIIRDADADITILVSSTAQPGNWLAVNGKQEYGLVLTLYDTPVAKTTGLARIAMPTVERIREERCG